MNDPNLGRTRPAVESYPRPDLADALIVLVLAAAIDIFVFWLASQATGSLVFQSLPSFITGAFSGIWSSIATGSVGIGLVIVKAMAQRRQRAPNYLTYTMITAGVLFVAILGLVIFNKYESGPPPLDVPSNVLLIDFGANQGPLKLDLESPLSGAPQFYRMQGTYRIQDGIVYGHIDNGTFKTTEHFGPDFPAKLTRASVQLCYLHKVIDVPGANGAEGMQFFPREPRGVNSTELDIDLQKNGTYVIPGFDFQLNRPPDYTKNRGWLCSAVYNSSGYVPGQ